MMLVQESYASMWNSEDGHQNGEHVYQTTTLAEQRHSVQ